MAKVLSGALKHDGTLYPAGTPVSKIPKDLRKSVAQEEEAAEEAPAQEEPEAPAAEDTEEE